MPVCPGSMSRSVRYVWPHCSVCASSPGSWGSGFLWWAIAGLVFQRLACSTLQMMAGGLPNFSWPVVIAVRVSPMQRTALMGSPVRRSEQGRGCLSWRKVLSSWGDGCRGPRFGRWRCQIAHMGAHCMP